MSTHYPRYNFFLYIILIINGSIFCNNQYKSKWGDFIIHNNSVGITDEEIIGTIDSHTLYMNSKFGSIDRKLFSIIISNKNSQLYNNDTWNWSLGITRNNTIIIKSPSKSNISKTRFLQVLKHELNHLYLNRLMYSSNIPRWFSEGFAMYYANENFLSNRLLIAKNIHNKGMFDIDLLDSKFNSNSKFYFDFAYAYSQILFSKIINVYSEELLLAILRDIRKGRDFDKAFYNNTMLSINDYNTIIFTEINSKFWWLRFIKLPSLLLVLAPLLSIISFILIKIRNKRLINQWELEEKFENEK